jgi:hypothetical protein
MAEALDAVAASEAAEAGKFKIQLERINYAKR